MYKKRGRKNDDFLYTKLILSNISERIAELYSLIINIKKLLIRFIRGVNVSYLTCSRSGWESFNKALTKKNYLKLLNNNECSMLLDNKRHIFFIWQVYFFTLPQWVVNRESVYSYCQMFGVNLRKTLSSRIISARKDQVTDK